MNEQQEWFKTVLILTTKWNKEYIMSEEEYNLFKCLSYKYMIIYLKDLDESKELNLNQ